MTIKEAMKMIDNLQVIPALAINRWTPGKK